MDNARIQERIQETLERAEARQARRAQRRAALAATAQAAAFAGGPTVGSNILVAEGDSWFDYPGSDVLEELEDVYGYDVKSVAKHGATMEDMTYNPRQLDALERCLRKLKNRGKVPKAILLSGGGNDLAGDELTFALNHADSGLDKLNEAVVDGVINVRLKAAYENMIGTLSGFCDAFFGRPDLPVLVHGYDFPVPDGRGFLSGFWFLPGPWLRPSFLKRGYEDLAANTETMAELLQRFNDMLETLSHASGFEHVHYVSVRETLDNTLAGNVYKEHWANELHPTETGFELVVDKFEEVLGNL